VIANISAVVAAAGHGGWPRPMQPFGFFPLGLMGGLTGLLLLAGFVLLAIWAFRALLPAQARTQVAPTPAETPLDVLARRFAAGEISADEYQKARAVLSGTPKT